MNTPLRETLLKRLHARLFRAVPDPAAGQVWRCPVNGEVGRVHHVTVDRTGFVSVHMQWWRQTHQIGPSWGLADIYAVGIDNWRRRIRQERMVMIGDSDVRDLRVAPPSGAAHA